MESDDFLRATDEAVRNVYEKDTELVGSRRNERSLAHRFAVYLESEFGELNVDCEYNPYGENPRPELPPGIETCMEEKEADWIVPDILIHARKSKGERNLAVFEVRSGSELDECDRLKLKGMTAKDGRFRYDFGVGVEFYEDHCDRLLFVDGRQQGEPTNVDMGPERMRKRLPGAGGPASGSREMTEETAKAMALNEEARRRVDALSPEMALERYNLLKDEPITELSESEYAERLVLAEKLSTILKGKRKQKPSS